MSRLYFLINCWHRVSIVKKKHSYVVIFVRSGVVDRRQRSRRSQHVPTLDHSRNWSILKKLVNSYGVCRARYKSVRNFQGKSVIDIVHQRSFRFRVVQRMQQATHVRNRKIADNSYRYIYIVLSSSRRHLMRVCGCIGHARSRSLTGHCCRKSKV